MTVITREMIEKMKQARAKAAEVPPESNPATAPASPAPAQQPEEKTPGLMACLGGLVVEAFSDPEIAEALADGLDDDD